MGVDHPFNLKMKELNILEFPDAKLRKKAKKVGDITPAVEKLADNMAYTMYKNEGIGLAATQVNKHKRMIVMDTSSERDDLYVMINPSIINKTGVAKTREACLSVPGMRIPVTRSETIVVEYTDLSGVEIKQEFNDIESYCIQHEVDHLNGKLIIDFITN